MFLLKLYLLTTFSQGFAKSYPDIRSDQLVNLILCRGDISRSDARQLAMDTLGDDETSRPRPQGIFSEIG
jgi:hypothetical protein